VLVEGVGGVIRNYYDPASRAVRDRHPMRVTFADDSRFWRDRGDPRLVPKMPEIIASVRGWGAGYLDKADPVGLADYRAIEPDVVIVATPDTTHVDLAGEWLKRPRRPEQIFQEKPLAESARSAWRLLGIAPPDDDGVLAFDHYGTSDRRVEEFQAGLCGRERPFRTD
jgi:hypothetical protein